MANIIVDGFATYGIGNAGPSDAVGLAMLSGAWASASSYGSPQIGTLPWDTANDDLYYSQTFTTDALSGPRRVLPATASTAIFSFYYACAALPTYASDGHILDVHNASNSRMCRLHLDTTGTLSVWDGNNNVLATTSGPVIVAESAVHIECKVTPSTGEFEVYVGGTLVLNGSGLAFTNVGDVAQFQVLTSASSHSGGPYDRQYISHLIVRDTTGSYNNDIVGDRKVATLFINADDPSHQGWTGRAFHRFGVGILDLSGGSASVFSPITTQTDLGANDFTLEGQFRFKALPTGSNKATLFSKWDETSGDKRSYQLYLGGPSLENGLLVFRTSTDGANGTVVEKAKWDWVPQTDQWYHVALVRDAGVLTLYIDGVQYGGTFADADTYYASGGYFALGCQQNSNSGLAGTFFQGWQDEFRFSKGIARYTGNFTPPTEGFPRNASDPNWGTVIWLSSWDNAVVADDGPLSLSLTAKGGAAAITPNDGAYNFQTANKSTPNDDSFIEAALIPATNTLNMTAVPADSETVTVGTTDGTTAAVYTFKTALSGSAFEVLIGADVAATAANLTAAINATAGAGTTYGTGTTANADVSAAVNPSNQVVVTALTPGSVGNAIASTETLTNGSWTGGATLSGGADIPSYSQFSFERMPTNSVTVDSLTLAIRQWRTAAGPATVQSSFVGGSGGVANGTARSIANTPTIQFDTFETDPDTGVNLTPSSILAAKVRVNRTV